jgi:hypothetical protein
MTRASHSQGNNYKRMHGMKAAMLLIGALFWRKRSEVNLWAVDYTYQVKYLVMSAFLFTFTLFSRRV